MIGFPILDTGISLKPTSVPFSRYLTYVFENFFFLILNENVCYEVKLYIFVSQIS